MGGKKWVNWSKSWSHVTASHLDCGDGTTLCGLGIPSPDALKNVERSDEPYEACKRCLAREAKDVSSK